MASEQELSALRRAAVINFVGTLGRIGSAAFPFLAARASAEEFGLFALGIAPVNVLAFLLSAGFADATQFLAAHGGAQPPTAADVRRVRTAAVAGLLSSGGIAVLASLVLLMSGDFIATRVFGRPSLGGVLVVLGGSLPFMAVSAITTAALRASMRMGVDVLVKSFVIPGAMLLGLAALVEAGVNRATALAWVFVAAQATGAVVAAAVFFGRFGPVRNDASTVSPSLPFRPLWRFALPQSLNMALYQATFDLDLMLLGAAKTSPEMLANYRTVSEVARQLFSIRVAFAGAYGSLVARLRREGKLSELSVSLGKVSGWSMMVAAPVAALIVLHRDLVLQLAGVGLDAPSEHLVVLVMASVVACGFGMAGNVIGMSGLPAVNLANGILCTAVNTACNLSWVPRWGLLGAAAATATALVTIQILQIIEMRLILGVRFPHRVVARAAVPTAIGLAAALPVELAVDNAWLSASAFLLLFALATAWRYGRVRRPEVAPC